MLTGHPVDVASVLKGKVPTGSHVAVRGWVRTRRDSKAGLSFIHEEENQRGFVGFNLMALAVLFAALGALALLSTVFFAFRILGDTDRAIAVAYGAAPDTKAAYAKRITVVVGADGRVEQVIDKVDAKTHPATLLASLEGKAAVP